MGQKRPDDAEEFRDRGGLFLFDGSGLFVKVVGKLLRRLLRLLQLRLLLALLCHLAQGKEQALARFDRLLHGVVVLGDSRVVRSQILVVFIFDDLGEFARLEEDLLDLAVVLINRYARDDLLSRGLVGDDRFRRMALLIALLVRRLALVFAQVIHRIKADVDVVDVLDIDVAQAFDLADILDDLLGDDRRGIKLRFQLDVRSDVLAVGGKLQLSANQLAFCLRLTL